MAPVHIATERLAGWILHVPAADLGVALRAQLGDDEVAGLGGNEEAVLVLDEMRRAAAELLACDRFVGVPQASAVLEVDAAQLALGADAVNVAVFEEWGVVDRVNRRV